MARKHARAVPAPDVPSPDVPSPDNPAAGDATSRGRKFVRIFLMAAGGLAAPSLALAAFFLSNGGDSGAPAARAGVAQTGRVTTTTARPGGTPAITAPTTTTTTLAPVPISPSRDPFAPLVSQAPAGGAPAG